MQKIRDNALKGFIAEVRKLFTLSKTHVIEKDVKARVKAIVRALSPDAYIFMPVQTGLGAPDLDFIIDINGFALRIETKINRKAPSARQKLTIDALDKAGVPVLIIDQDNLLDVAIIVDYLLVGKQLTAFTFARANREDYLKR
jgi:hypothetical protein